MKVALSILIFFFIFYQNEKCFSQCKLDSIFTYRIVGSSTEIATIEYFWYDENDSLNGRNFFQYENALAVSATKTSIERKKIKGKWQIEESSSIIRDNKSVNPLSKHISSYDKKGNLFSEIYLDYKLIGDSSDYLNQSKVDYVYSKKGLLIEQSQSVWDNQKSTWQSQSKITTSYTEFELRKESVTFIWDTTKNSWIDSWKNVFAYDSLTELYEVVNYESIKGIWVPRSRTEYGNDKEDSIKYNIVQKWNGEKSKWINEFYYVLQLNELGEAKTEIHLSWNGHEWKIDLTAYYIYNEQGEMSQLLNDKKQLIVEWFCH